MKIKEFLNYRNKIMELQKHSYVTNFEISEDYAIRLAAEKNNNLKNNLEIENCNLIGSFSNNRLVGFVWFFDYKYFGEARIHINQIVIDENYQRQGIASELLNKVEKFAQSLNIKYIDLNVSENNKIALEMYLKNDFQTERRHLLKELAD